NNYSLGLTIDSPVILNAHKDTKITKNSDSDVIIVDEISNESINDFILPLKFKLGLSTEIYKNLELNLDYKRSFWSVTDQSDNIGHYVDQNIISVGAEYTNNKNASKYWKRISFRAGYNYDSGYLE